MLLMNVLVILWVAQYILRTESDLILHQVVSYEVKNNGQ